MRAEISIERPVAVRRVEKLRNKEVGTVKVQWQHQNGSGRTWEPAAVVPASRLIVLRSNRRDRASEAPVKSSNRPKLAVFPGKANSVLVWKWIRAMPQLDFPVDDGSSDTMAFISLRKAVVVEHLSVMESTTQMTHQSWHCLANGMLMEKGALNISLYIITSKDRSTQAMVVDECDSSKGCHNDIVDASKAVWNALEVPGSEWGETKVTWSDA
ncbi:hypothetical protein OSB04_010599 [Centaurea solstitialis]|uniref:Uncharacterized protein n=1 Tax=Centaurea solstitialis TaxID=347529 RepID=A0AA38TJM4_9ASTR|nr:hypothetical protein OSB04_010599 [Centaurea solstitialis]